MKMPLYQPERIKHVMLPEDLSTFAREHHDEHSYIYQEKLDGARYLLYIGNNSCKLRSRRISEKTGLNVDKTGNCPHLTNIENYRGLEGTVLDGEITSGHNSADVTKIMGCNPSKAIERQKEIGFVTFRVFDILRYKGQDLCKVPLWSRLDYLNGIKDIISNIPAISIVQCFYALYGAPSMYNMIVSSGGEGIVIKRLDSAYGKDWIKVKKLITCDTFISGLEPGGGKYQGLVGSLQLAVYYKGRKIIVGKCSGMDDSTRIEISNNPKKYLGSVIEVKGQEFTKDFKLRHPRFVRFRPDKRDKDCVYDEQINIEGALIHADK